MPASDSLDEQLARGPEAAADAFEAHSERWLELVLDDIAARDIGNVPVIVEGPQLMPGFATQVPPGWCVWLVPDPARARMTREERQANEETLAGRPVAGRSRTSLVLQRDAILASRIREGAILAGRPVIEVPPHPDCLDSHARRLCGKDHIRTAPDRPRLICGPLNSLHLPG
jgi:hypothetical protein